MIPDQKLRQIRDRPTGDIVEIVEAYVKLKRSGRSWRGLCKDSFKMELIRTASAI